jgi:hypothetical protein
MEGQLHLLSPFSWWGSQVVHGSNKWRRWDEDGMAMDEKEDVRKAALEFMISFSEANSAMVRKFDEWTAAVVRGCLEGMGELPNDHLDV